MHRRAAAARSFEGFDLSLTGSRRMQMPDKIVLRSVESLIPYARNARTHSDAQVAQIAGSIREFGFTNPLRLRACWALEKTGPKIASKARRGASMARTASSPATAACWRRASST